MNAELHIFTVHFFLCSVYHIDNARDGDVEVGIHPIVFEVSDRSAARECIPQCTACTNVVIRDDFIIEDKFESFSLSLSHRDEAVVLTSTNITVTIEDEDSESFSQLTVVAPLNRTPPFSSCGIDFG